jgi:hypothetical protein
VEFERKFPGWKKDKSIASRVVDEHSNQFRDLRRDFVPTGLGFQGKVVLVLVGILGLFGGMVLDATFVHSGGHPAPRQAPMMAVYLENVRYVWNVIKA